jgi:hypothetical protein
MFSTISYEASISRKSQLPKVCIFCHLLSLSSIPPDARNAFTLTRESSHSPTMLRKATSLIALLVFTHAASTYANRHRFHDFFPNSAHPFRDISMGVCNASLKAYEDLYDSYTDTAWIELGMHSGREIYHLCKVHENCILENSTEVDKNAMSTAEVILGLLPTLLAVLSPSLAEIALLASQRPLLALLLSLGAPGVLQTRVFEYNDPGAVLDLPEDKVRTTRVQLVLGPWPPGFASAAVTVLEYVGVMAAAANVLVLCVELKRKSILSWGCTRSWPIIVWAIVPFFIHSISALGYRLTLDRKASRQATASLPRLSMLKDRAHSFFTKNEAASSATDMIASSSQVSQRSNTNLSSQAEPKSNPSRPSTANPSILSRLMHRLMSEFTPCAVHPPTLLTASLTHTLPHPSTRVTIGILLQCTAGFLSFFHLLYGTVTFSGLMFITIIDAVGYVMMRLLASALVCRFIVLVEIGGMRGARFGLAGMR